MAESYQKPIIGKNLLRSLMLQLYSNPRCIYREYIQNGLDAINEAVKLGILKQNKDGLVSINIGKQDIIRRIQIASANLRKLFVKAFYRCVKI